MKKTDLRKFIDALNQMGCGFTLQTKEEAGVSIPTNWDTLILIDGGVGYSNLEVEFHFRNENFVDHAVWEF